MVQEAGFQNETSSCQPVRVRDGGSRTGRCRASEENPFPWSCRARVDQVISLTKQRSFAPEASSVVTCE